MKHIVKRQGHEETFDQRKLYATIFRACMNADMHKNQAETLADEVTKEVKRWIKERNSVTSSQIFKKTIAITKKRDNDAAFWYETHRDLC